MSEKNSKREAVKKMLLGVIIGGAVGSVVGATMSKKEVRDQVRQKLCDTSHTLKGIVEEKAKPAKKGFWHILNSLFVKKD